MGYENLKNLIANKMRVQHIYQPVMIKVLLENDDMVSVRKVAEAFLEKDESQIEYYEQITRSIPSKVLQKHEIVDHTDMVMDLSDIKC